MFCLSNRKTIVYFFINLFLNFSFIYAVTEVLRPRGVPLSKKSFYDPGKDFQCLDGSAAIPFLLVNDDYCDCDDGSDEPGTSACSNGVFHCSNIGYIEKIIPSSRVNDGICDCCDSSDEYNSSANCPNNCLELGEQMRLERERFLELLKQGNEIRQTYIETAKQKIEETKQELENLKANLAEIESTKNSKFEEKIQAEELEKEALEKHRAKEDVLRQQKEEEEMKKQQHEEMTLASSFFNQLDTNNDETLSLDEMKSFQKFDRNNDGIVSDDEAKFYSNGLDTLVFPTFMESSWPIIKPILETEQPPNEPQEPKASDDDNNDADETHDDNLNPENSNNDEPLDHEEDSEEMEHHETPQPAHTDQPAASFTLEHDEQTKQLVEQARKARDEYNEIEAKFQDIQTKIRESEVLMEMDFGPNREYMALKDQCFELHENEYIYKLCPFDSASQRSKNGGSETSLGRWGKWIGGEHNPHEKFLMEGGAQCWNGPARSVIVSVSCGAENQLTRAHEPNRCEYAFDFKTPAACVINQQESVFENDQSSHHHDHTEL